MKKFIFTLILLAGFSAFGQEKNQNKYAPEKSKNHQKMMEEINKNIKNLKKDLSPEERKAIFQKVKTETLIRELEIPKEKQDRAKALFMEYFQSLDNIVKEFKSEKKEENISDEEARRKIKQGFETAQKLLDNRKLYADKFLELLTPQQVLKLYKTEKKIFSHLKSKFDKHKHHQKEKNK